MSGQFSAEVTGALIEGVEAGLSFNAAAREAGVPVETAKGWLKRGRREEGGSYAAFAAAVDVARERAESSRMTVAEFLGALDAAVRRGSVQALKLWWQVDRDLADDDRQVELETRVDGISRIAERRRERLARNFGAES